MTGCGPLSTSLRHWHFHLLPGNLKAPRSLTLSHCKILYCILPLGHMHRGGSTVDLYSVLCTTLTNTQVLHLMPDIVVCWVENPIRKAKFYFIHICRHLRLDWLSSLVLTSPVLFSHFSWSDQPFFSPVGLNLQSCPVILMLPCPVAEHVH